MPPRTFNRSHDFDFGYAHAHELNLEIIWFFYNTELFDQGKLKIETTQSFRSTQRRVESMNIVTKPVLGKMLAGPGSKILPNIPCIIFKPTMCTTSRWV